jgi:hypothetical protein
MTGNLAMANGFEREVTAAAKLAAVVTASALAPTIPVIGLVISVFATKGEHAMLAWMLVDLAIVGVGLWSAIRVMATGAPRALLTALAALALIAAQEGMLLYVATVDALRHAEIPMGLPFGFGVFLVACTALVAVIVAIAAGLQDR